MAATSFIGSFESAGGKETTTGMVLKFAESVAVYVPPADSKDPMKLVAATRGLVGASFK